MISGFGTSSALLPATSVIPDDTLWENAAAAFQLKQKKSAEIQTRQSRNCGLGDILLDTARHFIRNSTYPRLERGLLLLANYMSAYLWIALGGALGSVARFALNGAVAARVGESFPWGTMLVNVSGSFVIGWLAAFTLPEGRLSAEPRAFILQFLMIGICGGFTTFSAFSLQTLNLLRDGEWLYAGGNVILSVLLCLAATWLGYFLGAPRS
jgi:CrcB protein